MAKRKDSWFKHYSDASNGATLRSLWDAGDYEAYGFFWRCHELLKRFEDPNERGVMTISWATFARETGWKPSKCRRVLARICSVSKIEMEEKPGGNVTFRSPNWLELQETRGGKRLQKNRKNSGEERRDTNVSKKAEERELLRQRFNLNSSERYELWLSPEAQELRERLEPRYGKRLDFLVPDILGFWGGQQNFLSWVENKERTFDAKKTNHDLSNFVEICIKKELGIIA